MHVRHADSVDATSVLDVHRAAFGGEEEAELVAALVDDPSARPVVSLVAEDEGTIVGHVLLTHATIEGSGEAAHAAILAPLAVDPDAQGRGVGGELVRTAVEEAAASGVRIVFVLGHPEYYPRFGFAPAGPLGFEAPYLIAEADAGAWMVLETVPGTLRGISGRVKPADALMRPELWRE